jgi:hypothetical protein
VSALEAWTGRGDAKGVGEGVAVTTTVSGGAVTVTVSTWGAQVVSRKMLPAKKTTPSIHHRFRI